MCERNKMCGGKKTEVIDTECIFADAFVSVIILYYFLFSSLKPFDAVNGFLILVRICSEKYIYIYFPKNICLFIMYLSHRSLCICTITDCSLFVVWCCYERYKHCVYLLHTPPLLVTCRCIVRDNSLSFSMHSVC